jgi:hypothetical protein
MLGRDPLPQPGHSDIPQRLYLHKQNGFSNAIRVTRDGP